MKSKLEKFLFILSIILIIIMISYFVIFFKEHHYEKAIISNYNIDPSKLVINNGYTKENLPTNIELEIDNILQYPELPSGCEITGLTIILNYFGYDVNKVTLANDYLNYTYQNNLNFNDAFIGNPFSNDGYGCFANVIEESGCKYLQSVNSKQKITNLTGTDLMDLLVVVANGNPVMVWSSMYLSNINNIFLWKDKNNEDVYWPENEHVMVIKGYNLENNTIIVCDPLVGIVSYDLTRFQEIYDKMNKQALTIY